MVWIMAVGSGGGGGTGSGDGTFFGFGGGGGGGATVNLLIPAIFVPPELDIQVDLGGSTTSSAYVTQSTNILYNGTVLVTADSGNNGGTGTGSGATGNGAGGTGGSAASSSVAPLWSAFAIVNTTSGAAGTAGSTGQSLSTITWAIGGASGSATSYSGQYGYFSANASPGRLTFSPMQTFGGSRRTYDVIAAANEPRHRVSNGAGGGGGGSRQLTPSCPGHQGGNGLVIIVAW